MVQIMPVIVDDNKPVNMPSSEEIFKQVHVARRARSKSNHLSGVPLFDESSGAAPYAWVRYGPTITMGEALTHHFVGQALYGKADAAVRVPCVYIAFESNGWGYIVMEYIDGSTCDDSDAALIATAVESLITVRGPTAVPGHVGGGPIRHYFFTERESPITYDSVKELEDHINGILRYTERKQRARFGPEVEAYGLRLCFCDISSKNFMKDNCGRIVAFNFGLSCFMPPSFFPFAQYVGTDFTRRVARRVKNPESTQLSAILGAFYATVLRYRQDWYPALSQAQGHVDMAHRPCPF